MGKPKTQTQAKTVDELLKALIPSSNEEDSSDKNREKEALPFSLHDALAENRKDLDKLSTEDKVALAERVILSFSTDPRTLAKAPEVVSNKNNDANSFYEIFRSRVELYSHLNNLGKVAQFKHFEKALSEITPIKSNVSDDFLKNLIDKEGDRIAAHLVSTFDANKVICEINKTLIQGGSLSTKVESAAIVKDLLDRLQGDRPLKFFDSRDCNADLMNQFSMLVCNCLGDKKTQDAIALKLSKSEPSKLGELLKKLQELSTNATGDNNNPFRAIEENLEKYIAANKQAKSVDEQSSSAPEKPSLKKRVSGYLSRTGIFGGEKSKSDAIKETKTLDQNASV